ncbi:MAG: DMT family transporter [Rhodospirillales bacterium]
MESPTRIVAPVKGIACMVGGGIVLVTQDALTKWLTDGYPVGEILFWRALFSFIPLLIFVWHQGSFTCLKTRRPGMQALRAIGMLGSASFIVVSFSLMPIADAIALNFTGPLFVTALATPFLAERVGWRRWTAVCLGFTGVIVMLRPGGDMQWVVLLPVASAIAGAIRDIITRYMSDTENSTATLFYTNLLIIFAGLCTLPFGGWHLPSPADFGLFAAVGCFSGSAHFLLIRAYHYSEVAVVTPFKYLTLIWAVLFGYVVWGDIPDRYTIIGSSIIVASGLYILYRETWAKRRAAL